MAGIKKIILLSLLVPALLLMSGRASIAGSGFFSNAAGSVAGLLGGSGTPKGPPNFQGPPCTPGIPCIVDKTPNDPTISTDGPNAAGMPNAKKTDSATCDADFMNQIYARAWMEVQRENIMNEVVIRKPDSVMEYTCFDQLTNFTGTGAYAANVKITSTKGPGWINRPLNAIPSVYIDVNPGDLAQSLQRLVLKSLKNYLKNNFAHTFLGGLTGKDYAGGGGSAGSGYNCDMMNSVHFLAQCQNIIVGDDPFMTFTNLISADPRKLPPGSTCKDGTLFEQGILDVAENKNFQHVNFDQLSPVYLDHIKAGPCMNPPIPTGVMVTIKDTKRNFRGDLIVKSKMVFEEKVCPNPGCWLDRPRNECR